MLPPRLSGMLLFLAFCLPSPAADDPVRILVRLRDSVLQHSGRIPNHTCLETVERNQYEPGLGRIGKSCDDLLARRRRPDFARSLSLDISDRLRLDVALAADREIYAWPGAARFEEGGLDQFILDGSIGTGPFASLLLSLFDRRTPRFVYEGEIVQGGRRLLQYSFVKPEEESAYRVILNGQSTTTGYTAILLVDPATAGLVRLSIRTDQLPAATTLCEADTILDYGKVPLGGIDYLLPVATRQIHIGRDGAESENSVTFSACREFHADSAVEFGDAPKSAPSASAKSPAPGRLPGGLPIAIDVDAPIECGRAAAGDRIQGHVVDAAGKIPRGARVDGRLLLVETHHRKPVHVMVAIRWDTVDVNGASLPLSLIAKDRHSLLKAVGLAVLRSQDARMEGPAIPSEDPYGVYRFAGDRPVVPAGFRTTWLTAGH